MWRRFSINDLDGLGLGKGQACKSWQYAEAQTTGHRLENKADLVAEAVTRQAAHTGLAGETPAEQSPGHGLTVGVVDEVYMEDPFGNILEIYSHSYELTYSAGAYQQVK